MIACIHIHLFEIWVNSLSDVGAPDDDDGAQGLYHSMLLFACSLGSFWTRWHVQGGRAWGIKAPAGQGCKPASGEVGRRAERVSIIRTATFMVLPGQMRTKRHGPFTGDPDYFHSTFFTLGTVDEQ
jgi:hypothetical protein